MINVIVLKLKNGDVVFGEFADQTAEGVTIRSPLQFVTRFTHTPKGIEYSYLFPLLYFPYGNSDEITFNRDEYITQDIANSYYESLYYESLILCMKNEEYKMEMAAGLSATTEDSLQDDESVYNEEYLSDQDPAVIEELQNTDENAEAGYYGYSKNEDGTLGSFTVPNKQTKH